MYVYRKFGPALFHFYERPHYQVEIKLSFGLHKGGVYSDHVVLELDFIFWHLVLALKSEKYWGDNFGFTKFLNGGRFTAMFYSTPGLFTTGMTVGLSPNKRMAGVTASFLFWGLSIDYDRFPEWD